VLETIDDFNVFLNENPAVLAYFSTKQCNVCKVLKPKIKDLLKENFPEIKFVYVDTEDCPEIAAQNSVFAVPTITVFFDGKEFLRKSRNVGLEQFKEEIARPYEMLFS